MASRGRKRRHRSAAHGRTPYQRGIPRSSRYAGTGTRRSQRTGPNAKAAKAAASKGLGHAISAADKASSIHAGILAVGAAYGAAKAGKSYLDRRRRRKGKGPRRDNKGRFR
jgi:hypothetical protein